jgi:hypothetical protein
MINKKSQWFILISVYICIVIYESFLYVYRSNLQNKLLWNMHLICSAHRK